MPRDNLGQLRFSGAHFQKSFGPGAGAILAPEVDPAGDALAYGRAIHRATDLAYHVASAVHAHTPFALAEPYRREGLFPFRRLPE